MPVHAHEKSLINLLIIIKKNYFSIGTYLMEIVCRSVGGGSGGESKGKRKQNLVPVQINEILNSPEEGFTVEGSEVGMVVIAGKVTSCEKATTKSSYRVRFYHC